MSMAYIDLDFNDKKHVNDMQKLIRRYFDGCNKRKYSIIITRRDDNK